jgi:hypothetical protein
MLLKKMEGGKVNAGACYSPLLPLLKQWARVIQVGVRESGLVPCTIGIQGFLLSSFSFSTYAMYISISIYFFSL